jgi:hypothetical protein
VPDASEVSRGIAKALTRPLRAWDVRVRWLALVVAVLLGVGWTLVQVRLPTVFHSPDSSHYLKLAAGHTELVEQPFASRQLGPRVAAGLAKVLGGDIHGGFLLQGFASLAFAMGATCWLALRTAAPRWMLLAMMLVPSWAVLVQYLVLPDLWYAALLAALLVMLEREWYVAAAVWMLPLMLSRESTSLTLVCFLAAAWPAMKARRRRWLVAAIAVVAAVLGSFLVAKLAAGSRPNVEHLPQAVYMFAKLPWNFLRNVVGLMPWSDANPELCRVPVWSFPVHLGPVHALGVCGFSFMQQLLALEGTLTNFGLLPLLTAVVWWRVHKRNTGVSPLRQTMKPFGSGRDDKPLLGKEKEAPAKGRSALLRFALLYGGVSFVLAPLLGAGFVHLMQYAWPLFLVALPGLFDEMPARAMTAGRGWASVGFFALSLGVPVIERWHDFGQRLAMGLVIWAVGYGLLRVWLGKGWGRGAEVADSAQV